MSVGWRVSRRSGGQRRKGGAWRVGWRRRQRDREGQGDRRSLSTLVAHGHFNLVRAVPQILRRNRKALITDGLGRSLIVGDFDLRDFRLSAGLYSDFLFAAENRVNGYATQSDSRRQGCHFELKRLHDFRAGGIYRAHGYGIPAGRKISRIQRKFQPIAFNNSSDLGFGCDRGDRRLSRCQHTADNGIRDNRLFCDPFSFQARRNKLHVKGLVHLRALATLVGDADAQCVLGRAQFKGIQIEIEGRLFIGFDDLTVNEEFHHGDFGLASGVDSNDLGLTNFRLRRSFEIVRNRGRQGGNLEFSTDSADIAFNVGDGDIQAVFAGFLASRFDGEGLISGDHLAIKSDFYACNILVGTYFDSDCGVFGQGLGKEIVGQEQQWHRYRRPQCRCARCPASVHGLDLEREVVARAIGPNVGVDGDDVLRTEQIGQTVVNGDQLF